MSISPSDAVRSAGQRLLAAGDLEFPRVLNEVLNQFLGWPFRAASGTASDFEGQATGEFASLVHTTSTSGSPSEPVHINSDRLACAIETCQRINNETLGSAYDKIARAKRLKKSEAPHILGVPSTTVTLGIIIARETEAPLEGLAEHLERMNRNYPDSEWPDMLVVLSKGTVSYAAQFPGDRQLGDMLPPAEGALGSINPPCYVVLLIRPSGAFTYNRMLAYLLGHLAIFSPGANLPNWHEVLVGTPQEAIPVCGYQYNLAGRLMPVPRQYYNDRYLPPRPVRIEDEKGALLATLQFIPWQDGGVILLKGKLPLVGLMVFLGKDALRRAGIVNRPPDVQISYVLPITQADFGSMLNRIQKRSNMIVRADPTKFVVQQVANEGSSSPFMARLFIGILHLRDVVFAAGADRHKFDKAYETVLTNLINARTSSQEIERVIGEHFRRVSDGTIARIRGNAIQVDESISAPLGKEVDAFLNCAVRALKGGMQGVVRLCRIDMGFLFQKTPAFEKGMSALTTKDPQLAAYLRQARTWSERLLDSRNAVEHYGWTLPQVRYSEQSGRIRVEEPHVSNQPVSEFVAFMFDRLSCFIEDVAAHCLQGCIPASISIAEIPLPERNAETPERFRLTLSYGGMPVWRIAYHQDSFEQT